MPACSTYLQDKLNDLANGVAAYALPSPYLALFYASAGQSPRSTAVTVGQTTVPAILNGHMYKCTTAGTTGSSEPTWPTGSGSTVTDGTAVWTEMTPDFLGNTSSLTSVEANYTGYARVAISADMAASANGSASNSTAIAFASATGGNNLIAAAATYDASTAGNELRYAMLTALLAVGTGVVPQVPVGDFVTSVS